MTLRKFALVLAGTLAACGSSSTPSFDAGVALKCHELPLTFTGTPGRPAPAQLLSNVFFLPVKVGATAAKVLVDTGAPVTLFDPASLPAERLPIGQGPLKHFEVASLSFDRPMVVGSDLNLTLPTGRVAGILGGDLTCHFPTSFNYRDATVTLGTGPAPANLEPLRTVPVTVEGGGLGALPIGGSQAVVKLPPTRLVLRARLDGIARTFIVDSGASYTVVSTEVFDALIGDGRKVIDLVPAQTVMGAVGTRVTRSRSLEIGGVEVRGSLVSSLDGPLLEQLGQEIGHKVDGLLGGTFLREFYVTVDSAQRLLSLSRYTTRNHIWDELTRVGIAVRELPDHAAGAPRYQIDRVFPGSDAAKAGLASGTKLIAIDGNALESLDPAAVDKLLLGSAGTIRTIQTDSATREVAVEDLLALQ